LLLLLLQPAAITTAATTATVGVMPRFSKDISSPPGYGK
jgi:hypothetical protein